MGLVATVASRSHGQLNRLGSYNQNRSLVGAVTTRTARRFSHSAILASEGMPRLMPYSAGVCFSSTRTGTNGGDIVPMQRYSMRSSSTTSAMRQIWGCAQDPLFDHLVGELEHR
jgi:hypothetical protein